MSLPVIKDVFLFIGLLVEFRVKHIDIDLHGLAAVMHI